MPNTQAPGATGHLLYLKRRGTPCRLDQVASGNDLVAQNDEAEPDTFAGRFAPAASHNAGGGIALYRRCLRCHGHALEGSLSAHIRWCDLQARLPRSCQ